MKCKAQNGKIETTLEQHELNFLNLAKTKDEYEVRLNLILNKILDAIETNMEVA